MGDAAMEMWNEGDQHIVREVIEGATDSDKLQGLLKHLVEYAGCPKDWPMWTEAYQKVIDACPYQDEAGCNGVNPSCEYEHKMELATELVVALLIEERLEAEIEQKEK